MIQRCIKCHLPGNYPGITFDSECICNFCKKEAEKFEYPGVDVLKKQIEDVLAKSDPNRKYDCIVGVSGGRDSSYLLYIAKEVFNLKVLALTLEHDFMTQQARNNIKVITERLGVDVVYVKNDVLNKGSRKSVKAWSRNPDAAMSLTFCTGCRYGIKRIIPEYAKKHNVPILLVGDVPMEQMDYRVDLLCDNRTVSTKNKMIGYAKRLIKNPFYVATMYDQYRDYASWQKAKAGLETPVVIMPFYFMEWKQEDVISTIERLGWSYDDSFSSSWRSDCFVNMLRQYVYKEMLGFNDIDVYYGQLARDNEMTLQEAMQHIEEEGRFDENVIRKVLKDFYDVDYDEIKKKMKKNSCCKD